MGAASLQAVATRLVRKNGRDVSLVRLSRRAKDPSKPHRGTSEIEEAKITVKAFIADYAEDDIDGDAIRRGDQRALIEVNLETAGDINSATDFTKFDPTMLAEIRSYKRDGIPANGVPLNIIIPAGTPDGAIVLPELLTQSTVMDALKKAGKSERRPTLAKK